MQDNVSAGNVLTSILANPSFITFIILILLLGMMGLLPKPEVFFYGIRRTFLIKKIERDKNRRVISVKHSMAMSLFPSFMSMNDSQKILEFFNKLPKGKQVEMIVNTPGGLVLAAEQIAQSIMDYDGWVNVYVPQFAMSGGTLVALAADKIYMGKGAVLGPLDPQLSIGLFESYPACSIVKALERENANRDDRTLIMSDVAQKALKQLHDFVYKILARRMDVAKAEELALLLTQGSWTHDFAITYDHAKSLGLWVEKDILSDMQRVMSCYPVSSSAVQYRKHKKETDNSIRISL